MKPTDIQLTGARCSTQRFDYRSPMKFGGRVARDITILDVVVDVRTRDGRIGRGFGSMTMSSIWAWPAGMTDPVESSG